MTEQSKPRFSLFLRVAESRRYTKGVDMWSIGCILAEMLLGKPLFPGTSTLNQIERIMATIQPPTRQDIESIQSAYSSSLLEKAAPRHRKPFEEILPDASPDALDLLNQLLQFNPEKRITAEQALAHPYVEKFRSPDDEHGLTYDVIPPVDDDVQLSVAEYRSKLYESIIQKKTEVRRQRRSQQEQATVEHDQLAADRLNNNESKSVNQPNGRRDEKPPANTTATGNAVLSPAQSRSQAVAFGRTTYASPKAQRPTKSAPLHHARRGSQEGSPKQVAAAANRGGKGSPQVVTRARPISAQYNASAVNSVLHRNTSDNLAVTSSKVVPQQRPSPNRSPGGATANANRPGRRQGPAPSDLKMSSYTQSHASISKSTLSSLQGMSIR